ncbi:MAG: YeeE/YedE family protein [Candidatus Kariarchaeaceae archaeon]|jgi:uncharacterized membrane protein YedE/YeeE
MAITAISGIFALLIGLGTGIVLQKGRACTNTAFRNLFLIRNYELALFIVITVTVELMGYYILSMLNLSNFSYEPSPIPLSYIAIPIGGFLFGLGTVIAGGCAGGVCYRVGEGSIAALLAFFGFASGIALFGQGPIGNYADQIQENTEITQNGDPPSLESILPRWFWTVFLVIISVILIRKYMNASEKGYLRLTHLRPSWTPILTGILLGILGTLARLSSTISGRKFGLSTTDGIAEIFETILLFESIGWAGLFILGLILGALIGSIYGGEFKISQPSKEEFFRFFGGGILLGCGAILASGCNFGHIFGGIPELGISSIIALLFMISGNWLGSFYYYIHLKNTFPQSTPKAILLK